ncbi:MAG: YceH family protein [Holophagales bacterium]|nr:MAG: YceH family protein [Holophagales bacterium]
MAHSRPLDAVELRLLGALMEKERTTPEQYPLTVSALLTACNQKTSREPVMELSETVLVEALDRLRAEVLVWRIDSARAERWRHCLDRRWQLDTSGKLAVMALLLLRGAQTAAELRTRSERLHRFASLDEVEAVLARLASEPDALVRELPRRPGQRETRWIHLAGTAEVQRELEGGGEPRPVAAGLEPPEVGPGTGPTPLSERVTRLEAQVAELVASLAELRTRLGE